MKYQGEEDREEGREEAGKFMESKVGGPETLHAGAMKCVRIESSWEQEAVKAEASILLANAVSLGEVQSSVTREIEASHESRKKAINDLR